MLGGKRFSRSSSVSANSRRISLFSDSVLVQREMERGRSPVSEYIAISTDHWLGKESITTRFRRLRGDAGLDMDDFSLLWNASGLRPRDRRAATFGQRHSPGASRVTART